MGQRYGEHMMNGLEHVFQLEQALHEAKTNRGIERLASSHVLEFYTPTSARRVLEYMAIDYVMFNLSIPAWVEGILEQDAAMT